jgi:SAM-dependent methyltransferase
VENDQARFFDERAAAFHDTVRQRGDTSETVAFLERLARGGPALELAIGTGRVALPLAARGITVDGIDISEAMVARLRAKPGGDQLAVTIGDFAAVAVSGLYRLVFVVANSLCNLGTQDDQVRCFENVAAHLTDDGSFVVDGFIPDAVWLRDSQYVETEAVGVDHVMIDVGRIDAVAQRLEESHVVLSQGGVQLYPVVTRYVWPSELDLMARLAGLRLKERWADWSRKRFTAASKTHVSVYAR